MIPQESNDERQSYIILSSKCLENPTGDRSASQKARLNGIEGIDNFNLKKFFKYVNKSTDYELEMDEYGCMLLMHGDYLVSPNTITRFKELFYELLTGSQVPDHGIHPICGDQNCCNPQHQTPDLIKLQDAIKLCESLGDNRNEWNAFQLEDESNGESNPDNLYVSLGDVWEIF